MYLETIWKDVVMTKFCPSKTVQSSKLLLPSSAQSILFSGPLGTHDHIFFFVSRLLCVLKWGPFFNEKTSLTTTGYPTSTGK
jgi:hypothetical protein